MSDDLDDTPETRETPPASSAPAAVDHDEEPEERRDTPARTAAQAGQQAGQPPGQAGQDPAQAAAEEALRALEGNALYQTLPAGYKRKVLSGQATVEEAVAQRQRQLLGAGNSNARRLAEQQARAAEAIQAMEASHRQSLAELESKMGQRIEKLLRQLTGEPEPEVKPVGPADPLDQLLAGMAQKIDGLTATQAQQAEEALVQREMRAVEEYSAADVERAISAVPWYEQAERYVEQQAFTAELLAINDAYPELSDAQAEQLAKRRVMDMAGHLMVEARTRGVSLAAEVIGMAQKLGFRPQQEGEAAPEPPQNRPRTAPPPPRPGTPAARLADQQRRENGVVGPTTGARGNGLREMSRDIADKARGMSDEDWADFIGEGKDGERRLRQVLSQRAE